MVFHVSTGILRIVASQTIGRWWAYLECCPEIGRYYRHQLLKFTCAYRDIMNPKLGPHITIVRYEIPTSESVKAIDGNIYPFLYSHEVFTNNKHFWLDIRCEAAFAIRKQMGLSEEPLIPFHLTIGVMPGT